MGKFTAQVKGGLHANYASTLPSIEPYNNSMDHKRAAQYFAHKGQFEFRAILDTLATNGVGSSAVANYSEISASPELGGMRPIVSTPIINRAATTADINDVRQTVTNLSSAVSGSGGTFTPNPVYNGDRNPLGTR
jgi:hypothetical protein